MLKQALPLLKLIYNLCNFCQGNVLDSFARQYLWLAGLDYAHGTGHGVGHCLNVHEGPSGISWRPYPNDPGLRPKQILSNEPGYYKVGEYGIRHEDLVEIISITRDSDHPRSMNSYLWSAVLYSMDSCLRQVVLLAYEELSMACSSIVYVQLSMASSSSLWCSRCAQARGLLGDFEGRGALGFSTLTLVPHQRIAWI
ncbi:Putative Xaa-Pro aminopeptidase FRA1 [Papilio xuthus]|uniref:Putative Xaa-Pro aminopeptidase FRA1 n=1 Tax=Papilio xuthus TaxID=66420 RepID=A0A0N1IHE4_PAPXU|nr:Putative Xaa-Pro aminopeptidase FRA1 [Papilio xuthus]